MKLKSGKEKARKQKKLKIFVKGQKTEKLGVTLTAGRHSGTKTGPACSANKLCSKSKQQ